MHDYATYLMNPKTGWHGIATEILRKRQDLLPCDEKGKPLVVPPGHRWSAQSGKLVKEFEVPDIVPVEKTKVANMSAEELRQYAKETHGIDFDDDTPAGEMRAILTEQPG